MSTAEIRSNSALFKREEQLRRWQESDTNKEPAYPKHADRKIKFSDGCIFLAACAANDREEVSRLIAKGADIDTGNVDGLTALHQACIDDNLEMVEFLVASGADINRGDNEGWTPLHATASCGFLSIARFLIESGARVDAANNDGDLPLDVADSPEMQSFLQNEIDRRGIDPDEARHFEERQMLSDANQWLNAGVFMDSPHPETGATALHVAAAKGYLEVIRVLLLGGADPDAQDFEGWTPLHAAAHWAQREAIEVLTDSFCDMEAKNCVGQTPMDVADPEVISVLEECRERQATLRKERPALREEILARRPHPPLRRRTSVTRMSGSDKSNIPSKDASLEREALMEVPSEDDRGSLGSREDEEDEPHEGLSGEEEDEEELEEEEEEEWASTQESQSEEGESDEEASVSDESQPHLYRKDAAISDEEESAVKNGGRSVPEINVEEATKKQPPPFSPRPPSKEEPEEPALPSWRQPVAVAKTKQGNGTGPVADRDRPVSEELPPAPTTANIPPLRRATSLMERDKPFYERLRQLKTRIAAASSVSSVPPLASVTTTTPATAPAPVPPPPSTSAATDTAAAAPRSTTPHSPLFRSRSLNPSLFSSPPEQTPPPSTSKRVTPTTNDSPLSGIIRRRDDTDVEPPGGSAPVRRSFVPPVRDDESETQRKAHAKRVRETRRSTQGVTLEDIRAAQQTLRDKQSSSAPLTATDSAPATSAKEERSPPPDSSATVSINMDRRPSWKLMRDEGDKTKFSLERSEGAVDGESNGGPSTPTVTLPLRKRDNNSSAAASENPFAGSSSSDKENKEMRREDSSASAAAAGAGAAISRKRRPKRRSTGVVQVDLEEIDPDRKSSESPPITTATVTLPSTNASSSKPPAIPNNNNNNNWGLPPSTAVPKERTTSANTAAALTPHRRNLSDRTYGAASSGYASTSDSRPLSRASSVLSQENGEVDYKKLYEESCAENEALREKLRQREEELSQTKAQLSAALQSGASRSSLSDGEKRERRAMERKFSEMEEELKNQEQLKAENQRLRDENGALIRVISKLSK